MDYNLIPLIVASISPLIALVIFWLGRRKLRAETAELEARVKEHDSNVALSRVQQADAFAKGIGQFIANQEKLQDENTELFKRNTQLEKLVSDSDNSRTAMTARLADREAQIVTLTNHLKALEGRQRDIGITQALINQQQVIIQMVDTYQKIIEEREKTMEERVQKEVQRRTGTLVEKV